MSSFKISGHRPVAGKKAGETISTDDLAGCNIDALVQGGHLTPTTKTVKVTKEQEQ